MSAGRWEFVFLLISDISLLLEAINNVVGKIDTLFAYGRYDSKGSYQLPDPDTKVVIPPRRNAVADKHTLQKQ